MRSLAAPTVDPTQFTDQDHTTLSQPAQISPLDFSFDFSSYFGDAAGAPQPLALSPIPLIPADIEGDPTVAENSEEIKQEDTTLCSVAFSLVMLSNRKGYSAADLDLKLRTGYRYGQTTAGGCRIDNAILLRVLAEIV